MIRTRVRHRCQLLESYLILHNVLVISSGNSMTWRLGRPADDQEYCLRIDSQWFQRPTHASVRSRLDTLGLIPFLQQHGSAWIGVTDTGEEMIAHLEDEAKS
ncbi:MAG: hypothetical protein LZF60_260008 [Nitrospira sp.]|nr:MAG: hypothetical protein LZF60_260008 [Nitrospira sp.]